MMCNERKSINNLVVVWYFVCLWFNAFVYKKIILWSNMQEMLQFYNRDSFRIVCLCNIKLFLHSVCVFAWGFLAIAKKHMGWGRNLNNSIGNSALIIMAIKFIDPRAKRVYWVIVFLKSSMCSMNVMFPMCPIPGIFSSNEHLNIFNFQCSAFNTEKSIYRSLIWCIALITNLIWTAGKNAYNVHIQS